MRNYIYISDVDHPANPGKYTAYPLFDYADLMQPRDTRNKIEASFLADYNLSYDAFLNNALFSFGSSNITLYSENDPNGNDELYVPIVHPNINKISEWAGGTAGNQSPVSFKTAKEILLRMRMECSSFPIPIRTKDLRNMHNPPKGSIRSVELKTGNQSVSYIIGSRQFWDRLDGFENTKAGSGLHEFEQFILDKTFAKQVYDSWTSSEWETFFSYYLTIGFRPESAATLERTIIHFSDLHIGKNGGLKELTNTKKVVYDILKKYKYNLLKPIVVITGDLVDFGFQTEDTRDPGIRNIRNASKQIERLQKEGFPVIILAGNHDYCSTINVKKILAEISVEIAALTPLAPLVPGALETAGALFLNITLLKALETFLRFNIEVMGYNPEMVSGWTLDRWAKARFESLANHCMRGYEAGSIYTYKENYLRPKNYLSIVAVDNQDLEAQQPLLFKAVVGLTDGMFLGNGDVRLARGKISENQIDQLQSLYRDRIEAPVEADSFIQTRKDFIILCTHNWVDFHPNAIRHPFDLANIEFFRLVLTEAAKTNYDGKEVQCWQGSAANNFMYRFFETAISIRFSSPVLLKEFAKGIINSSNSGSFTGFDWNLFKDDLLKTDPPSAYYSNSGNPAKADDYETHKIINENTLYPFIETSDMFLVGHRHHITGFTIFREEYKKQVDDCLNAMDNTEAANIRAEINALRSKLQQDAKARNMESKQLLLEFLHGLAFYNNCASKAFADSVFYAACDYLVSRDFSIDREAEELKYNMNKMPEYYSEMNDVGNNQTWRELKINLKTGVVTATDYPKKPSQ